jgi:threonine dehydratase
LCSTTDLIDHSATPPALQHFTGTLLLQPNHLALAAVQANARIQGHVLCTNLMPSHWLSSVGGCSAFLKLESEQHTNSFKVSGTCRLFA